MSNRSMKDFLKYARQTVEPEEEKKEIGLSDYITEGHAWDDLVIGAGQFLQNIADMTERATRPDDKTPSEWEKHQNGLLKNFLTGTRATAANLQEGRETPELEDASAPYFLRNMLRSAPESIGTMVGGFMLGAPLGGLLGAAGRAGVGAAMKSSAARSALANVQSAYNAQNIGGKIARATIPTSPTTWSSLFSSAGLEANSERQQAINELIDNAKRNGTYIPDQTELEAEQRTQDIFGGNLAWIALNNLPQYGLMFGKPARSILGKLGKGILAGNSEGVEEVGQQAIHDYVLGESPNFKNYRDSYVTGFGMGAGMHGGVGAARYAADRITGQPSEEELEEALKAYKAKRKEASKIFSEDYVDFRGEVQSALDAQGAYREQTARQGYRDATESIGIDNFMRAIGQQESGGDYEATNGRTGASGKFQIMPENWSAWAQDAGLPADAPMTPENQERVARNKMLEYYNRFGNWRDVAIAWYAGEGEVTNPSFNHDAPQGNGDEPSVNEYADSVMSRFEKFGSGEQRRGGNIFGVENYDMPTQGDNITQQVSQLKDGWQSVIPQIGGVLKDRFGINATISSAARSADHNADVGGAPNSYHIIRDEGGDALDIVFDRDTSQEEQDRIADYFKNTGLFSEVLYHDVGSGAHLHLGGLKTDNIQSRADQLFNERYAPNNISTPQWQQRTNRRQEEPEQEEHSKPLFDINADDEQTQKLLERFATERWSDAANEDSPNVNDIDFFSNLFDDNGIFQNTAENRNAIRENYGDELSTWAENILKQEPQEQPAQPQVQPKPQQQQGTQSQTGLVDIPVMQAADNFLEQLRQNKNAPQTLLALQQARNAGDVTAVENILKQNNIPIQTQEPAQNNAEAEPVATQPQQNKGKPKLTPEERMIHTARKPVAEGKKNVEKRKKHGKVLIKIADKKRIEIPSVDRVALENGSTVIVQKWRDKLLESGALPESKPQEQPTQPEQPAQPQKTQPAPEQTAEPKNAKVLEIMERSQRILERQGQQSPQPPQPPAQPAPPSPPNLQEGQSQTSQHQEQKKDLQSLAQHILTPPDTQTQPQTRPAPQPPQSQTQTQTQQGQSQPTPVNSPYFIGEEAQGNPNPYVARSQGFDSKYYSDVRDAAQRHGGNNVVGSATSFAFSKPEDRDAFIQEAHNIISPQRQTQNQPAPQPQQNVAEEPTQPETQNEQPQQESQPEKQPEDDRNVFDLLPETGELNDVEEEPPQEQLAQKGTQQEPPVAPQSLPTPNPKRRRSKKAQALHEKMKTDTHPFIGEYLDRLFEHAKNKEDSYERQRALWELKHYEEIDITDEMLGEAESRLKQQHEERELPQEQPTQEPKPKIQNQELQPRTSELQRRKDALPERNQSKAEPRDTTMATPELLEGTEDSFVIDDYKKSAIIKKSALPRSLDESGKNRVAELAKKHNATRSAYGFELQDDDGVAGYFFKTIADRNAFIRDVLEDDSPDNGVALQAKINSVINSAKREALKIMEADKFPAVTIPIERSLLKAPKPKTVEEAKTLAKRMLDVVKKARDNGEVGGYAFGGRISEWVAQRLKRDALRDDIFSGHLNSKDLAKYEAAEKIRDEMNRGELTAEEAYAELERFLKTGRRSKKTAVKSKAEPKHDIQGDKSTVNTDISNVVDDKDLTPAQKLLQSFGKKLGVIVKFVNNPDSNFRGVHSKGVTYLNINSNKSLGKVFWHESFHWLRNNNAELYKALVKAAGITDAQREAYLKATKRTDLKTKDEINEEILCDMMDDVAKRTGLFQSVAGKNRGLVERAIQWLKDTLNKFIDHFRNPQGKLTTKQAQALADEFGRMADRIVDPNGDKIFRYNRRTRNVEFAGGRDLSDAAIEVMTQKNAQFGTKYSIDSSDNSKQSFKQRIKNIISGEPQKQSIHAKMKRRLESLSKMKIAAGHLPEGLHVKIDEVARVIRTGREYDWMNVLPSVGNEVAKQLNITQSAEMGNYIGKFLLDGAPNDTSAEATEFAKAMRDNPEMRDKIMAVRDVFDEWDNMSSEEQMIASTRYDKETAPLKERAIKAFREFRAQFFDSQLPIHYHVAAFEKATGLKLANSINPEIAFRNLRGVGKRAMRMIYGTEKTTEALKKFYPSIDFTGFKPLAVILESIKAAPETDAYKNFDQYIKACHFMDIHAHNNDIRQQQAALRSEIRNLETALNQTKNKTDAATLRKAIKKKEAQLDSLAPKIMETPEAYSEKNCADFIAAHKSEFDAAQKDIVKYSQTLLAIMADSGVISRSRYFSLLKAFPNYVPLPRAFDENENLSAADSLKHMLGSTKDPKDSIAAISNNTFDMIQRAEKNKAKLLLANLANFDGVGGIFELVDGSSPNDGTIIHFYENGKRKALQCEDESIVKAVNSMNIPTMNLFLRILRVPAAILRATATGRNPSFIAGNLLRDTQDAFIFSKQYGGSNITSITKDLLKSLNPITTYKYLMEAVHMSELYEEYAVSGAAQADFFSFDRDYKQEAIERLTKKNFKQIATPKGILQFLEQLGEWSELATRLRQYDKVKQSLAAEHGGINIYDDLVTAAFESRDLIDFARHGAAGQTWNTLTAFANPVLQGFDKQWRTYDLQKLKKFGGTGQTEKEWKISVTRLFLESVLPALVLTLLHKDEDWYKDDVQPWEKENYWILNEYMRVPKGADVGIRFFSNLTELLVSNESAKVSEVLRPLIGMLPDLMPTAFLPIFECIANYDLFRRRPIVPQRETNLYKDTPELQYGATSSKTAVFLGKQLGVSPRYIDHFIYGYTSGVGKGIVHAIDTVTPGRHAPWTRDWIPFLGRTLRTPYLNPKIVSDYYEEFSRQESFAQRTVWEKKHGNPNAKPPAEYDRALHARLKSINRAMQNLNSQERAMMDDPKLTSEQVEEKRKAIQEQRIKLCKKAFGQAR